MPLRPLGRRSPFTNPSLAAVRHALIPHASGTNSGGQSRMTTACMLKKCDCWNSNWERAINSEV
eukprot:7752848-Alexandrium_andersonii.AAC.1